MGARGSRRGGGEWHGVAYRRCCRGERRRPPIVDRRRCGFQRVLIVRSSVGQASWPVSLTLLFLIIETGTAHPTAQMRYTRRDELLGGSWRSTTRTLLLSGRTKDDCGRTSQHDRPCLDRGPTELGST